MLPPRIPNRYDDDEQRLKRLDAQQADEHRRWLVVFIGGWLVLAAIIPFALAGWGGVGLLLAPIGLGMVLGAGVQLALERLGS